MYILAFIGSNVETATGHWEYLKMTFIFFDDRLARNSCPTGFWIADDFEFLVLWVFFG